MPRYGTACGLPLLMGEEDYCRVGVRDRRTLGKQSTSRSVFCCGITGAVAELARLQGKTTSAAGRADDLFSSFDTDGLNNSGNGGEGGVTGGEAEGEDECEGVGEHTEELRRVDQEIENKVNIVTVTNT